MGGELSIRVTEILYSVGIVALSVVAGKLVVFLMEKVVRRLTEKTETVLDDLLLAAVEKPVFYLVVLLGVYIAFDRLKAEIGDWFIVVTANALFVLVVVLLVKLAYDVINATITWYGMNAADKGRSEIGQSIVPLLKKLVKIFVIVSGLIVVLDHFKYNISSLVAALGVSSLAIGLAAKDTLSNMISGFIIMADRPFRVGDRIEVDGKVGDVEDIGLRSTKVRNLDNNIVILPNMKLVDNVVLNFAYPENSVRNTVKIGVVYGSDVARVKSVMLEVARAIPYILPDPEPAVFFTSHGESALEFTLVYAIHEYKDKFKVLDMVHTDINRRFREESISMAFPTRTLHIINEGR